MLANLGAETTESEANEHITHILQAKCLYEVILLSDIVL